MEFPSSLEEKLPLSPKAPETATFPAATPYGTIRIKAGLPQSQNTSETSFQTCFAQKYCTPIIAHAAITDFDTEDICHDKARTRTWRNSIHHAITDWWLCEIILWLISSICLLLIVIILGVHDNQALPVQPGRSISLNTSVAILSTLSRYALSVPIESCLGQLKWNWFQSNKPRKLIDIERFDKASRGPWGSVFFLIKMGFRSFASLGAAIVLISLALDPFFQQLVSYPQRIGRLDAVGPSRSVNFSTISTIESLPYGGQVIYPDYMVTQAVSLGTTGDIGSLGHNPVCASSNCQWPPFRTLGVCSQCEDISDLLELGCLSESGAWIPGSNYSKPAFALWSNNTLNITSCGYFLNATSPNPMLMNGYTLNSTNNPVTPGTALWMSLLSLQLPQAGLSYWDGSYHFKDAAKSWPIQDVMIVMNSNYSSVYEHKQPMAAECVLRWCVQTIEAQSTSGNYSETILSQYTNNSILPYQFRMNYNNSTGTIPQAAHTLDDIFIIPPDQNETFFIPKNVNSQLLVSISDLMPAYFTVSNSSANPLWQYQNLNAEPTLYTFNDKLWPKPNNISEYFDRVASGLTTVIRNYPFSSTPVHGFGGLETYVHIQWGWFSLPVIVLLGTLILLVKTIVNGPSRGQGGIWKTSLLASLLHGFEETSRLDFGDAWELSEMREKAESSMVTFTPRLDGFRFHKHGLTLGQKSEL